MQMQMEAMGKELEVDRAKQEATRQKRLATLIDDSAHGRPIGQLDRRPKAKDA